MKLSLTVATEGAALDVSALAPSVTWSGDFAQCARTLSFGLLSSPTDESIPVADAPLGAPVMLQADGHLLFSGYVFSRQKATGSSVMEIKCFDRGIYLKRNKAVYKFRDMLPEDIARRVCADFEIPVGSIAETGVKVSRNFIGASLYQIIQTAYTLAAGPTGEAYQIRFIGDALHIVKKALSDETPVIKGGGSLMSAAVTESIEDMVNQVLVIGGDEKQIDRIADEELVKLYGVMQETMKQAKGEDYIEKAQRMLSDGGVSQKITVHNLGNIGCVTGNCLAVQEPYTGLYGLFWIDNDVHTWKNGLYLNKLALNFRRMMDEQEAGDLPEAKPPTGKAGSGDNWESIFRQGGG